jgi:glutamate synthase (NADPH/NADH) small chain
VDTPIPRGKNVVVLGAGNVAMDRPHRHAAGRRQRQDRLPAVPRGDAGPTAEIHHAEEEGIEMFLLTAPYPLHG